MTIFVVDRGDGKNESDRFAACRKEVGEAYRVTL